MKRNVLLILAFIFTMSNSFAQPSQGGLPFTTRSKNVQFLPLQTVNIGTPDMHLIQAEDDEDAKNGTLYKIGRSIPVNFTTSNSGIWEILPDGSKLWRLKISAPGAMALGVYYNQFQLPEGAALFLYNEDHSHQIGAFNSFNNPVNTNLFATEPLEGDVIILEYHQPFGVTGSPQISINEIAFIYRNFERPKAQAADDNVSRDFGDSETCEVNVNCTPVGTNWQDEKRGVVRILVKVGASYGWCSGSLINNTSNNCAGYILTADHCSGEPTQSATAANLNQWVFYFNYEASGCTNPGSEGTLASQSLTGCTLKAHAGEGGDQGSDFYLVLLNSTIPAAYNVYYNGWNRASTAATSGASIHHPAGDIKKISTFSTTLVSDDWNNSGYTGSHWRVTWSSNSNGWGVTEGGSSGSPIFDSNGYIIGDLTGGGSYCTAQSQPDYYGKLWYSWDQNTVPGTGAAYRLKDWLDPGNTGVTTLAGTYAPCGPSAPTADFSANNVAPCVNSTVTITDMSSGSPTSWAWTFSPTTVTYVGGTSASSQNPQVQFTAAGTYTVTLVATNSQGNDTEVKTAYITVQSASALPYSENFEGAAFPPTGITKLNPDNGTVAWGTDGAKGFERRAAAGNTGSASGSAGLNCYNYNTSQTETDALVIKPLSLVGATNPQITFKRAYKYYNNSAYYDELRVYVSTDCGSTWGTAVYTKTGPTLATSGTLSNASFTPTIAADWDTDTISLSSYVGQNVVVKFEVTNKYGQNVYIDDINIANGAAPVASVTIAASANPACSGASVTFTATPTNGGTAPSYQWKVNGANVGTNSATYTTNTLTTGDIVTVVMTSNLSGVTGSPATSNAITMTINSNVTPSVSITANPGTTICSGTSVTFTASPTNGGTAPSYQWKKNGVNVGTSSATFTTSTLANGDVITVVLTASGCASPSTATSNALTMTVNTTPSTPTVSLSGSVLTSSSATGNQWYLNGVLIPGATGQTYTATSAGTYTVIVTSNGCSSAASSGVVYNGNGISELIDENMYSIYPNPNQGSFHLSFAVALQDDYTIEIHNAIGQIVYSESLNNYSGTYLKTFSFDEQGKGVYFVVLRNSHSQSVKRVVIY